MKLKPFVVGAATVGLIALAGPAFAAGPPYTVTVGTNTTGDHPITAASTGTVKFSALNMTTTPPTPINMNCTSVTGTGTAHAGVRTSTSVNPVADILTTTWSGCTIPGGNATVTQSGTWNVTGTGTNATTALETITGYVGLVNAGVKTTANPAICNFSVTGKADGSFNESSSPQQLVISETGYSGDLVLSNVNGCLGRLQNGSPANFEATLNITSPDGVINLS